MAKGTSLSAPEGFSGSGNRLKYGRWLREEKTKQKEVSANPPGEAYGRDAGNHKCGSKQCCLHELLLFSGNQLFKPI